MVAHQKGRKSVRQEWSEVRRVIAIVRQLLVDVDGPAHGFSVTGSLIIPKGL